MTAMFKKYEDKYFSNIDESVKANVNLKKLIDVRNGVKWVRIFDMQNIMCIIQELCLTCCKLIDVCFYIIYFLFIFF